jgi:hypothetical protein
MSPTRFMPLLFAVLSLLAVGVCTAAAFKPEEMSKIEQLTRMKGSYAKAENVFKVGRQRSDIKVRIDNFEMPPFMGLGSWAAFAPLGFGQFAVMGDTVLFEDEVNPVMSAALDAGLEVTALHNHFFFDEPKVYFMHIGGMGKLDQLASGVGKMYSTIDEIRRASPQPASAFPGSVGKKNSISAAALESIFGAKGTAADGMFKITFGRSARAHGTRIGKEMGVASWAAFAGSDEQALVDGDMVMKGDELQVMLKSLRASAINIVAIHQHMVGEQPQLIFLHYWGKGTALGLAQAVKKALANTKLE